MSKKLLLFLLFLLFPLSGVFAQSDLELPSDIQLTGQSNSDVSNFTQHFKTFFYTPVSHSDGLMGTLIGIAFQIKNFVIVIGVVFLIVGVIKLLLSSNSEEDVKRWRLSIVWVSIGVFFLQITFSIWGTLFQRDTSTSAVDAALSWEFWNNIFSPIVGLFQLLAGFAFIAMMIYAFYLIVTGGGNEEKSKRGKNVVIFAVIGFLLLKLPYTIVSSIYGNIPACSSDSSNLWAMASPCTGMSATDLTGTVEIIAKVFTFVNSFLVLLAIILIIYAGWLILSSAGDDEKLKKAKRIFLYILIGLTILVASHAIFRFFVVDWRS